MFCKNNLQTQHVACFVFAALHADVPADVPPKSLHSPLITHVPIN